MFPPTVGGQQGGGGHLLLISVILSLLAGLKLLVGVVLWKNTAWDFVSAGLKWISDELLCFLGKGHKKQTRTELEWRRTSWSWHTCRGRKQPSPGGGEEKSREGANHEWGGSREAAQAGGVWQTFLIAGVKPWCHLGCEMILCRNVHRLSIFSTFGTVSNIKKRRNNLPCSNRVRLSLDPGEWYELFCSQHKPFLKVPLLSSGQTRTEVERN